MSESIFIGTIVDYYFTNVYLPIVSFVQKVASRAVLQRLLAQHFLFSAATTKMFDGCAVAAVIELKISITSGDFMKSAVHSVCTGT